MRKDSKYEFYKLIWSTTTHTPLMEELSLSVKEGACSIRRDVQGVVREEAEGHQPYQ